MQKESLIRSFLKHTCCGELKFLLQTRTVWISCILNVKLQNTICKKRGFCSLVRTWQRLISKAALKPVGSYLDSHQVKAVQRHLNFCSLCLNAMLWNYFLRHCVALERKGFFSGAHSIWVLLTEELQSTSALIQMSSSFRKQTKIKNPEPPGVGLSDPCRSILVHNILWLSYIYKKKRGIKCVTGTGTAY